MVWKYKIDLEDKAVFSEIEQNRGIEIPNDLKQLVSDENAATPEKYCFMVGNNERVFGSVLSFNKSDDDTVFKALDVVQDKNLFPFGIDPFGNYICLNLKSEEVVFWDHETDRIESTGKKLKQFIESLY